MRVMWRCWLSCSPTTARLKSLPSFWGHAKYDRSDVHSVAWLSVCYWENAKRSRWSWADSICTNARIRKWLQSECILKTENFEITGNTTSPQRHLHTDQVNVVQIIYSQCVMRHFVAGDHPYTLFRIFFFWEELLMFCGNLWELNIQIFIK